MRFQSLQPLPRRRSRRRPSLLAVLTALALALPLTVQAVVPQAQAAPSAVTLVGSLQSELGCAEDWDPACAATAMTDPDSDGLYTMTVLVPAGSWEIKVALDGGWAVSYGADGVQDGANIPLRLAADAELTLSWDVESHRLAVRSSALSGDYDPASDAALVADPAREGTDETFYFVLTDRFANGDPSNDSGGLVGGPEVTGLDPTDKGYYHGGDIAGIIENLDYIQSLGTTAIWLTPSFTNRPVQGTGDNASAGYHGYWITDFTSIDPHLGGNESLAALRDALHARGMRLYLDIITNHTADLIDYAEGQYSYVDTATVPYTDAAGQVVDISAAAGSADFPRLDPATSFPYTPVRTGDVVPDVLNDVSLYHNRGDSTWTGESVTMGDFVGLDDLMTEDPRVVAAFEDIYTAWMDFGVDGFRIDTVKHVNMEFWESWTATIDAHAAATNPDFFTFGEVYDADARKLSPYVRSTGMDATLDFAFQSAAVSFARGYSAQGLSGMFATDDYYTTPTTSAAGLPTFLGNHDMGRVGYLLAGGAVGPETLRRDALAHSLMFLTRGQPVVYYGDEQGFVGVGDGSDKNARQDVFATQVAEYAEQPLVDGTTAGSTDRYDTSSPLYQHISGLAALRAAHPALSTGSQIELYAEDGAGVYAFARVDRHEKVEHLVALNNADEERTVTLTTLTPGATYSSLYGDHAPVTADAQGEVTLTVPALGAVVLVADRTVAAGSPSVTLTGVEGAALSGASAEVAATTTPHRWAETSFSYRELGTQEWTALGTAEDTTPRVFADVSGLPAGTVLELRAVTTDAAGNRAADSALAVVGANLSGTAPDPDASVEVTVPGSHNAAMGCPGDWQPDCAAAALSLDPATGLYTGSFDLPAGTYEYKVAIGGSWEVNYGADGVADGPNITYTTAGGTVTFFYDPVTHLVWNDAGSAGPSAEPSATAAPSATAGATGTPTAAPSASAGPSAEPSATAGATGSPTGVPTAGATAAPSASADPGATGVPTAAATATVVVSVRPGSVSASSGPGATRGGLARTGPGTALLLVVAASLVAGGTIALRRRA
ncbi:alpha-amylase family glycosyl hydrolase [Actinomyces howellii]|uniref:Alpha-amylase n=1 Tax=Actinomyces howellii TaxID=52771 RepID=A0A448HHB1_9ACTO|nr:alpha-amylase family glycosyl hydrolase [Actinomyces howellii]VEG28453.1 Alpha-amylase precursor [Actinomyces howellii]